jgi:DNA polymerase type B, organellar and viral
LDLKNQRPEHKSIGDPCKICRLPEIQHRVRPKRVTHKYVGHNIACGVCGLPYRQHIIREDKNKGVLFAGIDGEGQGWTPHRYTMLACSNEIGNKKWYIENDAGLNTEQCLDFILSIPLAYRVFAYGFNYDLTMILRDLSNELLYYLFRPELRRSHSKDQHGLRPISWEGFLLNLQGSKFTVCYRGRERVIWDIWKFYQSKFTGALKLWKVGTEEELEQMQLMKDKRSQFDKLPHEQVRAYCLDECKKMAELAKRLVAAHDSAGLKLKSFYGAGSSASAMLDVMGIKKYIVPSPEEMKEAIASAFSGGRFENSVVGTIKGPIHSKDISSAYPYQLCFLPCLLHGHWSKVHRRNDIDKPRCALVRYRLRRPNRDLIWGPFPYRDKTGSICYPQESGGGWVWREEYLAAERIFPNVQFIEAFIMNADCECKPFKKIPGYYVERCRIGKSGPGIVIKLGSNSVYGKLAQSVGFGVFNNWIWAGLTTSGCRAQVLDILGLHKDPSNLLMVATDGIQSLENVDAFTPKDTNTQSTGKPLGGWESDVYNEGVFYARPGIYFPLNPTKDDLDTIRARGIGKAALLDNWQTVIKTWETEGEAGKVKLSTISRFGGAKTCISRDSDDTFRRSLNYGEWAPRPTDMTFNPKPKRERILSGGRLEIRKMPLDQMSLPYTKAMRSPEAEILKTLETLMEEQPDLGFSEEEMYE